MKKLVLNISLEILGMLVLTQLLNLVIHVYDFTNLPALAVGSAYGVAIGMTMTYGHRYIQRIINRHISWLDAPVRSILITVVSGAIFTLVAMLILNYIVWGLIFDVPIGQLYDNNWFSIKIAIVMYLLSSFAVKTIQFYMRWKDLAIEQEKLKLESLKLRFEALRSHVNPHFLFNSLSTLIQLIECDKDKAVRFTELLAETYRYIVDTKDSDLVPLDEEMDFVNAYLQLQSIRFGGLFTVENRIVPGTKYLVIPVSVQMLIENIFKHNVISRQSHIVVTLWIENDYIHINNTFRPRDTAEDRTPTGLANIRSRYEYLSGRHCIFGPKENEFTVALPLLTNQPDRYPQ